MTDLVIAFMHSLAATGIKFEQPEPLELNQVQQDLIDYIRSVEHVRLEIQELQNKLHGDK